MTNPENVLPIRASSFGGLFDCSLRWSKIHLDRQFMPTSPRALIGTGIHAGTAAFDSAKLEGAPMRLDDAAGMTVDAIQQRVANGEVEWMAGEPTRPEVERIALQLTTKYCADISPLYEWEAVELTTKPLDIDCGNGIVVRLTGTLDRARVRRGSHGITDLKSGAKAVVEGRAETKKHKAQIGTYEVLYEHTTGNKITAPGEIIGLNTTGKFNTGTGEVRGARELLVGDGRNPGLIEVASQMFKSGIFPPNPSSFLCSKKYCPHFSTCPAAE